MTPAPARKFLAIAAASARVALRDRTALVGRTALYAIILLIFSRLWRSAMLNAIEPGTAAGSGPAADAATLTWYMVITEWIILSTPAIQLDIERDAQGGDLATQLNRPLSYMTLMIARAIGQAAVLGPVMAGIGLGLGVAFTGTLPATPWALAALPLAIAAVAVLCVTGVAIGLTSLWLGECAPVYWVWHKLLFILGGLILPLAYYPAWLATLAGWTPFAPILDGPAALVFGGSWQDLLRRAGLLAFWGVLQALALTMLWRRAVARLDLHGG